MVNDLRDNIGRVHTTDMGLNRLKKNLRLGNIDVVEWCIVKILDTRSVITRKGKNWYVRIDDYLITVNAGSYTIITAHIVGPQ